MCGRGFSKEGMHWSSLDVAGKNPGGREGTFEGEGRISETMSMTGGGAQRPQGAVALAADTDSSQVREEAGYLQRIGQGSGRRPGGLGRRRETELPALEAISSNFINGRWDAGCTTGWHSPLVTAIARFATLDESPG